MHTGAGSVGRNHNAVLKESTRLLMELYNRNCKDWKRVVQSLKKASLQHEGDEELKQDQMLSGKQRLAAVKQILATQNQRSAADSAAPAASASNTDAGLRASQSLMFNDPFGPEGDTMAEEQPGNPLGEEATELPKPWYISLAQNLCKVPIRVRFPHAVCMPYMFSCISEVYNQFVVGCVNCKT